MSKFNTIELWCSYDDGGPCVGNSAHITMKPKLLIKAKQM